jgi:hypothetical protein
MHAKTGSDISTRTGVASTCVVKCLIYFTKALRKLYESFTKALRKLYESFTKAFGGRAKFAESGPNNDTVVETRENAALITWQCAL